jgi:hypothetical protein
VSFWLGLAWLCVGGDARVAAEQATDTEGRPAEEMAAADAAPGTEAQAFLAEYAPPAIEGPGLRLPEPMTRIYLDASYARTKDLSGLPLIAGKARNDRFAVGGTLRMGRFSFEGDLTFSNVTTIDVTAVPGGIPLDVDKHQTATSLGDLRLGVNWTRPLNDALSLIGGFGLRVRLPTHTVIFQFHLNDGSLAKYVFPYYFHVEPTLILGGSVGRFAFVINQGLLLMTGPDGRLQELEIIVPNLLFWSAHYAMVFAPFDVIGVSADLATDVQLNHIDTMYFEKVNDIVSLSLNVGLQLHFGRYRVDLVGRRGLTRDSQLFGVMQYAGTESLTVRLGVRFD